MTEEAKIISSPADAMEISVSDMLGWVLPVSLGFGVVGIWPTWLVAGWAGVLAELAAGVVVLTVMIGNGVIVVGAAKKGRAPAAMAFSASSLARMILCPLLTAGVWWVFDLEIKPLGVWMIIFYLTGLAMECVWIVRALRKYRRLHVGSSDETSTETNDDISC